MVNKTLKDVSLSPRSDGNLESDDQIEQKSMMKVRPLLSRLNKSSDQEVHSFTLKS